MGLPINHFKEIEALSVSTNTIDGDAYTEFEVKLRELQRRLNTNDNKVPIIKGTYVIVKVLLLLLVSSTTSPSSSYKYYYHFRFYMVEAIRSGVIQSHQYH